jgi:hypothetical protein
MTEHPPPNQGLIPLRQPERSGLAGGFLLRARTWAKHVLVGGYCYGRLPMWLVTACF